MPNGEIAETFPLTATFPSEEDVEMEIETAGAEAGVSPLDFDFLLFALPFAFAVDALDIVLEIAGAFVVVPKIIGIVIDFVTLLILGGWLYWRLGKIEKSKKERQADLEKTVQKGIQQLSKLQKTGKVSPQVFDRYMRLYGKQMGTIGKAAARAARKPATRALIRGGLTFLAECAFILGIIPFWTIMVILALREK
jgi:hypothetical protein